MADRGAAPREEPRQPGSRRVRGEHPRLRRLRVEVLDESSILVAQDRESTFAALLEAAHSLGEIGYLDRSAWLVEVLVEFVEAPTSSVVMTLQGRARGTEVFCTVEPLSGGDSPPSPCHKGYRKYLKLEKNSASIDMDKVKSDSRFDGKWVLTTNTELPSEKIALKYKELWQVERVFRDVKSMLHTRPVYHQKNENIRGHVFCSFLALILKKELDRRLNTAGHIFEWSDIKQDLKALQLVTIEENGKRLAIRSECRGVCAKVFQSVGVAIPPSIKEV